MMVSLRRFAAPLTAFVGLIMVAQILDLLPCGDEGSAPVHQEHAADTGPQGDDTGCGTGDGGAADCLCHVTFASTAAMPVVGEMEAARELTYAPFAGNVHDVVSLRIGHVPLG